MKKKQIIGLAVAVALIVAIGAASTYIKTLSEDNFGDSCLSFFADDSFAEEEVLETPDDDYIAVVEVLGAIGEETEDLLYTSSGYLHTTTLEYIDELMEDENNKGMLLYVDSPGGTVYESEELY